MKKTKTILFGLTGILFVFFGFFLSQHYSVLLPHIDKPMFRTIASTDSPEIEKEKSSNETIIVVNNKGTNLEITKKESEVLDEDEIALEINKLKKEKAEALELLSKKEQERQLLNLQIAKMEISRVKDSTEAEVKRKDIQNKLDATTSEVLKKDEKIKEAGVLKEKLEARVSDMEKLLNKGTASTIESPKNEKVRKELEVMKEELKNKQAEILKLAQEKEQLNSKVSELQDHLSKESATGKLSEEELQKVRKALEDKEAESSKLKSDLDAKVAELKKLEEAVIPVVPVITKKEGEDLTLSKVKKKAAEITKDTKDDKVIKDTTKNPKVETMKDDAKACRSDGKTEPVDPKQVKNILTPLEQMNKMQDFMNTLALQQQQNFQQMQQQFQQYQQYQQYQQFQQFQQFQQMQNLYGISPIGQIQTMPNTMLGQNTLDYLNLPVTYNNQGLLSSVAPTERAGAPTRFFGQSMPMPSYNQTPYPFHYTINNNFGPGMVNFPQGHSNSPQLQDSLASMLYPFGSTFNGPQAITSAAELMQPNVINASTSAGHINFSNRSLGDHYGRSMPSNPVRHSQGMAW